MNWDLIGNVLRAMVLAGLGTAGALTVLIWKKNLATKITYLRLLVQAVTFAAIFFVFSFSIPLLYVLAVIFAMTFVFGRLYCGWFCPFGFLMDLTIMVRKALKKPYRVLPEKLNKILHQSRYFIALVFLLLPVGLWVWQPPFNKDFAILMAQLLAGPFRPYSVLLDPMIPMVVPWKGPLVVGGVNFSYPYIQEFLTYFGQNVGQAIAIGFVAVTLAGSYLYRRAWCRFCPTGASLAVMNRFKGFKWAPMLHIEKNEEKCTKCGVCKRVCQVQVAEVYEQKGGRINTSMCMLCMRCAEMCPYEDALRIKFGSKTLFKSRNWLEPSSSE